MVGGVVKRNNLLKRSRCLSKISRFVRDIISELVVLYNIRFRGRLIGIIVR